MAKAVGVKWALSGAEPEDGDFLSNEDIVKKNKRKGEVMWPGKGPHTFKVKRLTMKDNKNGDPRISAMLVLANPKKSDAASWNGYLIFDGFNVDDGPGMPFLKRFLTALGITWDEFLTKTKAVVDEKDKEKQQIVQIGKIKFGEGANKDPEVEATIVVKPEDDYNDDEHMEIRRFLPASDESDEDDEDEEEDEAEEFTEDESEEEDEDEDEEDDDDEDEDEEDEDEEDEEDDEDEEEDEDAEEELREELADLKVPALKKRAARSAKKAKVSIDDMPAKKAPLIDWIVNVELNEPPF